MSRIHVVILLFAAIFISSSADAHKVIASVFPSGENIEGEIGFSNGDMAVKTIVEVLDEDNNKLGEVITDQDGFFTFTPTKAVNHVFRANLGAGHVAEVTFDISEMSHLLDGGVSSNGGSTVIANITPVSEKGDEALSQAQEELIASIMRDELRPLRREIAAYKEKNDLQSILGGMGYIFGIFGIAFYIAARRMKGKETKA